MASTTYSRVIPITTASDGSATVQVRLYGRVVAIGVRLGDLSTPDITITDGLTAGAVLAVTGLATDKRYQPRVLVQDSSGSNIAATYDAPAITGRLDVVIAGGGNTKSGEIVVTWD